MHLDLARLERLSIDAIGEMPDEELARRTGAPVELVPAMRGARTLTEARDMAAAILEPPGGVVLPDGAGVAPTLERFVDLRGAAGELDQASAKEIVRELKAVGGDLRALAAGAHRPRPGPRALGGARCATARGGASPRAGAL